MVQVLFDCTRFVLPFECHEWSAVPMSTALGRTIFALNAALVASQW